MFLLLQLADGTFPSGGFAHSAGLEAASVLGGPALEQFLDSSLLQAGSAALPFVRRAFQAPDELAAIDEAFDATLGLLGPNRASRAQGRALASAATKVWPITLESSCMHHACVFGALFGKLGAPDVEAAYLHGFLRTILSAAVRLGLVGPLEAQRMHAARAELLDSLAKAPTREPAQTAPLLEMYAALHERLDGRMFQS